MDVRVATGEVVALLAYDEKGEPVAFPAGKMRDRDKDRRAILEWMQKLANQ